MGGVGTRGGCRFVEWRHNAISNGEYFGAVSRWSYKIQRRAAWPSVYQETGIQSKYEVSAPLGQSDHIALY